MWLVRDEYGTILATGATEGEAWLTLFGGQGKYWTVPGFLARVRHHRSRGTRATERVGRGA